MRKSHILLTIFVLSLLPSCASEKQAHESKKEVESSGGKDSKESEPSKPDEIDTNNFRSSAISNSNNPMLGAPINRAKAEEAVQKLEQQTRGAGAKDRGALLSLMTAQRLAGQPVSAVIATSKKLVELELQKSVKHDLPDIAKLEVVLSAIKQRQFQIAEHFLPELTKSKNAKVKAGALTAQGIIAMIDGRLPEAVVNWNEALKASPEYPAAALNLGLVALKYGDFKTAKATLGNMQDNWLAQSGLEVAERLTGDAKKAEALCERVLSRVPRYKVSLYNCAVLEFQNNKNYDKAKSLLTRMVKERGGDADVEQKAYSLLSKIDVEEANAGKKPAPKPEEKKPEAGAKPAAEPKQ